MKLLLQALDMRFQFMWNHIMSSNVFEDAPLDLIQTLNIFYELCFCITMSFKLRS